MKDLLKKPVTFEKVEFWAATAIYAINVFYLLGPMTNLGESVVNTPNESLFENSFTPYSPIRYYFIPELCRYTIFYGAAILLSLFIVKPLVEGRRIVLNLCFLFCLYITAATLLATADTWMKCYLFYDHSERYVYHLLFKNEFITCLWLLFIVGFYTVLKYVAKLLSEKRVLLIVENRQLLGECASALAMWLLIAFMFKMSHVSWQVSFVWCQSLFFAIVVYWYTYNQATIALAQGKDFKAHFQKTCGLLLIASLPVTLLLLFVFHKVDEAIVAGVLDFGVGVVAINLSWQLYQYRLARKTEIIGLKTQLGRSSANLDFLRSQINPHFLFNALNTLYGTSLQENAERTGEGIQKLGDMMRFMLQENMQEKISLSREIDYLNNYIDLQKLRTQTSPDILILTEIDEQATSLQIAPMLLIPFVENAFKHGISLRETSHIKISLQTRGNELLFDVYNSIHPKTGTDPERDKSGIGLENVKQRLQLLYPKRHELVIRESTREFFIHLTINL